MVVELKNWQVLHRQFEYQSRRMLQAQNTRPQDGLPSDTKSYKQVMVITLRNDKKMNEEPIKTTKEVDA